MEQKDAKLTQVENEVEELLQERKKHLTALDEQKERNRVQVRKIRVLSALASMGICTLENTKPLISAGVSFVV